MRSVQEILGEMGSYLGKRQIPAPKRQAEELLGHILEMKRLDLYLNFERPLVEEELEACRTYLKRAGTGEPIEYIMGEVEFYGVKLQVDKRVLIPRPETELMVDRIAHELKEEEGVMWDLCAGSGCIGLALKRALPQLRVICTDISEEALEVARYNAEANDLEVEFYQGDFLQACEGPVNYLVTNPPYLTEEEHNNLFEPALALVGGLTFYERLAQGLSQKLSPGGRAWMEIGATQGKAVQGLFSTPPYTEATLSQDLAGLDRVISLEILG